MSEIAPVPPSARIVLSELFVQAARLPSRAQDELVDYYDIEAFGEGAPIVERREFVRTDAQAVEQGDVLLSRLVDAPRRAWVVSANRGRLQLASSDWLVLRASGFDPDYLRHLLVSNDFHVRFARAVAMGRKSKRAGAAAVGGIEIPAPPLPEQQGIGQVLKTADELRVKRNAVAATLDQLPGAVFREVFGDLSQANWPLARLADLLIDACVQEDLAGASERSEWLIVRAANITRHGLDLTRSETAAADPQAIRHRIIADGEVLVARASDALGPCAAVAYPGQAKWLAHEHVLKLRFDPARVCPEYARALFAGDAGRTWWPPLWRRPRRRSSIAVPDLADLDMPLPPMAMQEKFTALLLAARTLNGKLHRSARRLDALLGALRDAAFRGELRLN